MGNYRPFLQGPLPVANYTRIIIPGRFWTRPPSTKSTRMASSATPLHDSLIELAIPDAHAHAIKWYLNCHNLRSILNLDVYLAIWHKILSYFTTKMLYANIQICSYGIWACIMYERLVRPSPQYSENYLQTMLQ